MRFFVSLAVCMVLANLAGAQDLKKGYEAFQARDYAAAMQDIKPLADQGSPTAQSLLGYMYYKGLGVAQDHKKAAEWFQMAAKQGAIAAQYNLGLSYFEGEGVQQDYETSAIWFRRSAMQGHADGQSYLGYMYLNGFGVRQDAVLALMWFKIAHENGNAFATRQVAFITKFMSPQGISKAETKARDCLGSNYQTCGYGGFFVGWYDRWGVASAKHFFGVEQSEP